MRTALIVAAVVAVLLVGLALFASTRLDAYLDENRGWIEEQAEAAVGREVSFGDLGVTLWGGLGASIEDLHIGEDPAYGEGDFVSLERAVVRVKLWPALMGRYEVSSVLLEAPRIRVIQGPDGLSTDSLLAGEDAAEEPEAGGDATPALLVALLDIRNGELHYLDRTGAEAVALTVEDLDVEATDLALDAPIAFRLSARVLGAEAANLTGRGSVGPLAGDAEAPVEVSLALSPLPLDALVRLPSVAASMPPGASVQGSAELGLELAGTATALDVELRVDATPAAIALPETFTKPAGVPLSYTAKGRSGESRFTLQEGRLTLARAAIDTSGHFDLDEAGRYALSLRADDTSLAGWDALLPALAGLGLEGRAALDLTVRGASSDTGPPAITGELNLREVAVRMPEQPPVTALRSHIALADGGAVIDRTSFEVGGSPASFSGKVPDLAAPVLSFELRSPALRGESIGLSEPGAESADVLRELLLAGTATPTEKGTVVDATLRSKEGRLSDIPYSALEGRLHVDEREAVVRDLTMQAFGGRATLGATYDLVDLEKPGWKVDLELAGIDAGQLATSQLGAAGALIEGRLDTSLSLVGRGLDYAAIAEALTGSGSFTIADGAFKQVNLGETVLRKLTGTPGLSNLLSQDLRAKHPGLFSEGATAFQTLRSRVQIRDGRVFTDSLRLQAADFGLTGGGSIGLGGDVQLDTTLELSPALTRSLTGGGRTQQLLAREDGRMAVPVAIGGSLGGLSIRPDTGFIQQALARSAQDALVGEARNALSNLLGERKKAAPPPADAPASDAAAGADGEAGESPREEPAAPKETPSARDVLERGLRELPRP